MKRVKLASKIFVFVRKWSKPSTKLALLIASFYVFEAKHDSDINQKKNECPVKQNSRSNFDSKIVSHVLFFFTKKSILFGKPHLVARGMGINFRPIRF